MAVATCQFSQGVVVGGSGQSVFNFVPGQVVTLTDDGGPGADSYAWEILSWPAPLGSPPAITNSTLQIATVTPALDGVYIVKLTRVEAGVTTTDIKFFGVSDEDGLTLPSAGQTGNMTNQSTNAQRAGWTGRQNASTNFQLDAFLRFLKVRVGRYVGHVQTFLYSSSTPSVTVLTDGVDKPYRSLLLFGTGSVVETLATPSNPAQADGKRFRFRVSMAAGAGSFTLNNAATPLLTLTAPPSGTFVYDIEAVYNGSDWILSRSSATDPKAIRLQHAVPMLSGSQSTANTIMTRVGTCRVDPSKFPANAQIKFTATIEATVGKTIEVRLYNLTDGGYVAAAMSTGAQIPTVVEQVVSLPNSQKDYEVHIRMTVTGLPSDLVTCTNASLVLTWG